MSPPPRPLELDGRAGRPLTCVLYGGERGVAVVLPGRVTAGGRLGGSPARPDLHYVREVLQAQGLAVLEVWWDGATFPEDDADAWLDAHLDAALAAAAREGRLALVVGRSLGTRALARLVSRTDAPRVPTVWLAPLLHRREVRAALEGLAAAFVVGGTADEAFVPEAVDGLRARGAEVVVLDGADHGLGVADPAASARLLGDVLERLRAFVAREVP